MQDVAGCCRILQDVAGSWFGNVIALGTRRPSTHFNTATHAVHVYNVVWRYKMIKQSELACLKSCCVSELVATKFVDRV